jgi:hypothetical protein
MNAAWFPAIVSGMVAALLTSIIAPTVQHIVWKRQKLRDQKLVLTERLASVIPRLVSLFDVDTERSDKNQLIGEIDAILFMSQVLFIKRTKEKCYALHLLLKQWNFWAEPVPSAAYDHLAGVYRAASDALGAAYGEVLSTKVKGQWWIPYSPRELERTSKKAGT